MDPMANITEQLELANAFLDAGDQIADGAEVELTVSDESLRLAELVVTLHEWRTKGGFDPYSNTML